MIELCTIQVVITAVIEVVIGVHEADGFGPIPRSVGPFRIGIVAGIDGQACSHIEEASVGDGVLVVVTVVERENLPFQSTSASLGVPSSCLGVEDCLDECKPLGTVGRRIRILVLGRRQSGHCPKCLIVISFCFGLVGRHIIPVWADLV